MSNCEAFPLFPSPARLTLEAGKYLRLPDRPVLLVSSKDVDTVRLFFEAAAFLVAVEPHATCPALSVLTGPGLRAPSAAAPERGYALEITTAGVALTAADQAGFFSALQSLWQLLAVPSPLPCASIVDQPAVKRRAFQVDLGRQPESTTELKRLIRQQARYRFNEIQLYLENSIKLPAFGDAADPRGLAPADYVDLQKFADRLGVAVIPSLNLLGHVEKLIRHPSLAHLSEQAHGSRHPYQTYEGCLCPVLEESRRFIAQVIREISELTVSRVIMVGLDECWTLGSHPKSRPHLDTSGGAGELFRDWIQFLHGELAHHGKQMWMWEDMLFYHLGAMGHIPRDIGMNCWHYQHIESLPHFDFQNYRRIDSVGQFAELGHPVMLCCGPDLDHLHSMLRYSHGRSLDGVLVVQWGGAVQEQQHVYRALSAGLLWSGAYPDVELAARAITGCPAAAAGDVAAVFDADMFSLPIRGGGSNSCPRFWSWPENALARRQGLAQLRAYERLSVSHEALGVGHAFAVIRALNHTMDWVRETTALVGRQMLQFGLKRSPMLDEAVQALKDILPSVLAVAPLGHDYARRYWSGMPKRSEEEWFANLAKGPEDLLERLDRFQAAPSAETWPYARVSLHLDGFAIDACSHHTVLSVGEDGKEYRKIFEGNARLNMPDGPFIMSFPLESVPKFVRLEVGGFASLAFTRVRVETLDGTRLPARLVEAHGAVRDPEHLLVFDQKMAVFNQADVMSNWLSLKPLEANFVVLEF